MQKTVSARRASATRANTVAIVSAAVAVVFGLATVAFSLSLSSCGGDTGASGDYSYVYSTDPNTFNYLVDNRSTMSGQVSNFIDGLIEHDRFGILRPALAESWEYSADNKVWTFHIRKNVQWVTSTGETYADVKAGDWVTALKYVLDNKGGLNYLVNDVIENATEYSNGKVKDFNLVGVKALDDYTLEYRLARPISYFDTMLTYTVYYPVNAEFLASKGADFGKAQADSILYCGAYFLVNFTAKSVIEWEANPMYWDRDKVHVKKAKFVYFDGRDPDSLFTNFDKGVYVNAPLFADNEVLLQAAKKKYKDNIIVGTTLGSGTYLYGFNYDREAWSVWNNASKARSPKSAKAKADTKLAVLNLNFRKAFFHGLDRATENASRVGADYKFLSLRNSLSCPDLVRDSKGRDYQLLVEDALKERNPVEFGKEFSLADGQDPYYNPELAREYMKKAVAELSAKGAGFPIELDVVEDSQNVKGIKMAQSRKQLLESLFPGQLKLNIVETDSDSSMASTYFFEAGKQANYDLSPTNGWTPDYGDPFSYLQIYLPGEGALLANIGLDRENSGSDLAAAQAIGLEEYTKLVKAADAENSDMDKRYHGFAKAEAFLLDRAIILPFIAPGGRMVVTRMKPYQSMYSPYGTDDQKFKGLVVSDHVITVGERDKTRKQWLADKAAAIKAGEKAKKQK